MQAIVTQGTADGIFGQREKLTGGFICSACGDNLIEGLTVYFALKSGSATLTSLTAVTDQNGIATTSVRGAITGSVTVSAVTTAGGMQTVDITLVAGPQTPQSQSLRTIGHH